MFYRVPLNNSRFPALTPRAHWAQSRWNLLIRFALRFCVQRSLAHGTTADLSGQLFLYHDQRVAQAVHFVAVMKRGQHLCLLKSESAAHVVVTFLNVLWCGNGMRAGTTTTIAVGEKRAKNAWGSVFWKNLKQREKKWPYHSDEAFHCKHALFLVYKV